MADIVTASANPSGCGHYTITSPVGGVVTTITVHDNDLLAQLTTDDRERTLLNLARILRQAGVLPAQFVNRVLRGDEATNVKLYDLLGPGSAVTKTNIGTSYVNVSPGLNGERVLVDFTGCTQYRIILNANLVGTGAFAARVIRDSDSAVLHESTNLGAAGERELDTDWQTIPATFSGLTLVRLQAKSATAADDPVYRRCSVAVR